MDDAFLPLALERLPPSAADGCAELDLELFEPCMNAFYVLGLGVVGLLNCAVMALCSWALLRHSSPEMGAYKWHLFNVAMCSFLNDSLSALSAPILYKPSQFPDVRVLAIVGPLSLLNNAGIISSLCMFLSVLWLNSLCMAILFAFVYRYAAITDQVERLMKKKCIVLMAVAQLGFGIPMAIRCVISLYDGKETHSLEKCASIQRHIFVALRFSSNEVVLQTVQTLALVLVIGAIVVLIAKTLLALKRMRSQFSVDAHTYKYQRQLTVALTLQIAIPCALYWIPMVCIAYFLLQSSTGSQFFRLSVVVTSSHTTANGLIMLLLIRPYREALKQRCKMIDNFFRSSRVAPSNS